jgi:hypothetical protein
MLLSRGSMAAGLQRINTSAQRYRTVTDSKTQKTLDLAHRKVAGLQARIRLIALWSVALAFCTIVSCINTLVDEHQSGTARDANSQVQHD